MNKKSLTCLVAALLVFGFAAVGGATYIVESESNDYSYSAQSLDGAFSINPDADIFWATSYRHASVLGTNGALTDVGYYRFTVTQAGETGFFRHRLCRELRSQL